MFINIFNRWQTGHYFNTGPCPDPSQGEEMTTLSPVELTVLASFFPATQAIAAEGMPEFPPGRQCNTKGLTKLGAYFVRRLIAKHMLIDVDHLSEYARQRVLRSRPSTTTRWSRATPTPAVCGRRASCGACTGSAGSRPPGPPRRLRSRRRSTRLRDYRSRSHFFGVPLGTDTGGFSELPAPRSDAAQHPLAYPFTSYDGTVTFDRQVSGERTFDLNTDGVAHYGLFADLIADVQRTPGSERPMRYLFRGAEAYLQMWERAYAD